MTERDKLIEAIARAMCQHPDRWDAMIENALDYHSGELPIWAVVFKKQAGLCLDGIEAHGCAVMPVEATDEMQAGLAKLRPSGCGLRQAYAAMLAANPYRSEK